MSPLPGQVAAATIEPIAHDLDFSPLHARLQHYVDQDILPCASSLVMRGTQVLDYFTCGVMDKQSREPLRDDAIFRMYSNTKMVTSVALMMLFDEGRFSLDDDLANYLPEFSHMKVLRPEPKDLADVVPAERPVLIRHLLSHSSGLSHGFVEPESVIDQAYMASGINVLSDLSISLETVCQRVARLPLAFQPGTAFRYSLATDVCARLVEVLSGQTFADFLKARIFTPLGMVDTDFWVPAEKMHRFTTLYSPADPEQPLQPGMIKSDDARTGIYSSPPVLQRGCAGLVSTMADYLAFLRMLANGGEWRGARLLQPETLALMRTNQLPDGVDVSFVTTQLAGTGFGLGFAVKHTLQPGEPSSGQDEYYWGGIGGTHSWICPAAGITTFCATQLLPGFLHMYSFEVKALAYQIAGQPQQEPRA